MTGQRGQAVIETTVLLPLVLLASLLVLQLVWISWWQLNLWTASNYALRSGAIQGLNSTAMRTSLAAGMAAVQPQLSNTTTDDQSDYAQLLVALARSQLWSRWGSRIELLQPTKAQLEQQGGVIALDHNSLRYRLSNDVKAYVAARTIELEIWWCMPLRVPLAAEALAALRQRWANPVQGFCQQRQVLSEAPLWGLRYRLQGPLLSDYSGPN